MDVDHYPRGDETSYEWPVPRVPTQKLKCKLKVILKDVNGKFLGSDVSDAFFTLAPPASYFGGHHT